MAIESRPGKVIAEAVLKGGGAAVIGLPLVDFGNTVRSVSALRGGRIDYVDARDIESESYRFGAIVVPGAGSIRLSEGVFVPNKHGEVRLEAAAIAYKRGVADKIILLHGEGHENIPESNRRYLRDTFLKQNGHSLPEEVIVDDSSSLNTAQDMVKLANLSAEYKGKQVLIVTSDFHTNRAVLLARAHGIDAKTVSAEELILSENPLRAQELHDLYATQEMKYLKRKEWVEIAGSIWDSKARGWTALRQADNARKRVMANLHKAGQLQEARI